MKEIELEILKYNYWEHFKLAKDLSLILPLDNTKRKELNSELEKQIDKINKLEKEINDKKAKG